MIELVDVALADWLSTVDPSTEVAFERRLPVADDDVTAVRIVLVLGRIAEQVGKRDNRVDDVRGDDGAVLARQRPTRFFELDYWCAVTGAAADAHRVLGSLVRRLVDHDVLPRDVLPAPLLELGIPLDVELVTPTNRSASVAIRITLPVRPAPDRDISAPATTLHLDVSDPPDARTAVPHPSAPTSSVPIEERRWTTVRRRELIGRSAPDERT